MPMTPEQRAELTQSARRMIDFFKPQGRITVGVGKLGDGCGLSVRVFGPWTGDRPSQWEGHPVEWQTNLSPPKAL